MHVLRRDRRVPGFEARAAVSYLGGPSWAWDGTYSFDFDDDDDDD